MDREADGRRRRGIGIFKKKILKKKHKLFLFLLLLFFVSQILCNSAMLQLMTGKKSRL